MLEQEIKAFNQHLDAWKKQFANKYVLVKGDELIGEFDSEVEALAEGARLYGTGGFLVRCLDGAPADVCIPALTLGILHASHDYSECGTTSQG